MTKSIQDEIDRIDDFEGLSRLSLDTKIILTALKLICRLLYMIYMEMK